MVDHPDRAVIAAAIAAQEQLRNTLGDDIVDATIAALRARLRTETPAPSIEHERRLVTVLFMDVVDSTRIFGGFDPEDMMAIMDAALQTLAGPVHARGGRVTKFMGDGFLAVFGLHRTRENDAEMAVRAALGVVESARDIAADVARTHQVAGFQVRIGINTGLVATGGVTEAEDTVMGSAVNLASRIETAAPPGGILLSQSTYRQVRRRFDLEPAGRIDAKGFPEPVPVHLVTGERSARSADAATGIDDLDAEMVGRDAELDALLSALDDVVAAGNGRTVAVSGDAGIGKSRLVTEFESHLPPGRPVTLFRAHTSLENRDVPHSLLRDLVERCFDIRGDDPASVVGDKLAAGLGAHLSADSALAPKIDVVRDFLGYATSRSASQAVSRSPQQLRDLAVMHLIEFFQGAAATNPVLLLLDDLQWADEGSLAILEEIIRALAALPVLTIALTRPVAPDAPGRWEQLPGYLSLPLEPLSASEAGALVDAILSPIEDCPPELRTRLLEHAGGNPYYLEELVMMCIDDGVIVIADPVWSVHMDRLATLRVPTTLAGVIRARLDGLPPPEHTVLQQASVVGRVFWDAAVAKIAGNSGTDAIHDPLDSLQARQMIRSLDASSFSNAVEYAFSNALVRDATYEEVLLAVRREYHGIVADWLIATSGDREYEFVGLIAGHLEKAGRSADALEYLTRAAEAAWNSYAVSTAADFYDRALALTPDDDLERRYRLLLGSEKTSALGGDREAQRRALDDLEQITDMMGDRVKQSLVAIERTFLCFSTGDYQAALASARRAAEHAEATDDPDLRSRAQSALAWAFLYLEDWDPARAHGEQALNLAQQTHGATNEARAQNLLGMIALAAGELSEARSRSHRALEIARGAGATDAAVTYLNNHAVALTTLGDFQAAHEYFAATLDRTSEGGDRSGESTAHVNLAWVAAAMGDWEIARRHAEQGIAMKRRHENIEAEAEGLLWLGHALVGLGELDDAEAAYQASAAIRRDLEQTALGLGVEAGLARVALARGDIDTAMAHAEAILDHIDRGGSLEGTWEPLRIHLTVIEALRAAGDDRAAHVLQRSNRLLLESSEKITDADDRRSFLEEIPWHRRIRDLAASAPG